MKVLLPLFFLLLQANTYAQKNDTLRVYFDSSLRRVPQHMAQIAGQAFKHGDVWFANLFYPNGQILCEIGFENKKLTIRHGPYTLYNTSGVPIEKGNYSNDMLDGAVSTWFSSAKPSAYVEYQMGVKTGVSKQWLRTVTRNIQALINSVFPRGSGYGIFLTGSQVRRKPITVVNW